MPPDHNTIRDAIDKLIPSARDFLCRLISFPSWELFADQPIEYQEQVLSPDIPARVAIEAGVTQGWERWVGSDGAVIGLDRFGASAPYRELYQHLGLTVERITEEAERLLAET